MATIQKIRQRIEKIADHRSNIRLGQIEQVINQLELIGYDVARRQSTHNRMFTVNKVIFGVCTHKTGGNQLKLPYVDAFLNAMSELGLYDGD